MPTVIFDFDSTLISCESLEQVLSEKKLDPGLMRQIKEITNQGMSGGISFLASLEKRLSLAPVSRRDFTAFAKRAYHLMTPGMKELIADLKARSIDIWVVSGALKDVMNPLAGRLEIPEDHVLGIDLLWTGEGYYSGIDASQPINRSKWEGAMGVSPSWSSPKIAVGDGITDYALYEHGLVDHFIAFTENVRRQAIVEKGAPEAKTVEELRELINQLIK